MGNHNRFESDAQQPLPLTEQLAKAEDQLALHPVIESYQARLNQDTLAKADEDDYVATADGIFDTLGIVQEEAVESHEKTSYLNMGSSQAIIRLRRAEDVAKLALEAGYNRDANDDELWSSASILIDRLRETRADAHNSTKYRQSREYSSTSKALTLLVESSLRELGRRNNLGDDLTPNNLRAIQERTGLRIVDSKPYEGVFRAVIVSRSRQAPEVGRHHVLVEQAAPVRRSQPQRPSDDAPATYYHIPELAGPSNAHARNGHVPHRIGQFVLDPAIVGVRGVRR